MSVHPARCLFVFAWVACAHEPAPTRVDLEPLPTVAPAEELDASIDDEDPRCRPQPLAVIEPDVSGALNASVLRARLLAAKAFAERCCTGDESGDVVVKVTVKPEGYDTSVDLEPELSAGGPTRACIVGTFRRVIAKSFQGSALTVTVPLHIVP